jgi:hypothetical protein
MRRRVPRELAAPREVLALVNQARQALGLGRLRRMPEIVSGDYWEMSCPLARAFPMAPEGENPVWVDSAADWLGLGPDRWSIRFTTEEQAKAVGRAWHQPVICEPCATGGHDPDSPSPVDDEPGPDCRRDTVRVPVRLARWVERLDERLRAE